MRMASTLLSYQRIHFIAAQMKRKQSCCEVEDLERNEAPLSLKNFHHLISPAAN